MARKNNSGRPPDYSAVLGGSRGPQNPAHDSPSKPGMKGHTVDVRSRKIKSQKPAPSEPTPKAKYQRPDPPVKDNQHPALPHVPHKVMKSPKKASGDVWRGFDTNYPKSASLGKKGKK